MRNDLLFAFLPYLSVVLLLVVPVLRLASPAVRRGRLPGLPGALELSGLPAALRDVRHLYWGSPAWRLGFCLIFLAHLLGLALPQKPALWRALPGGSVLLQSIALGAGFLALAGWVSLARLRFRRNFPAPTLLGSATDTLLWTLLALALGSGILMTLSYRPESAWYMVTLVPYLRSLAHLHPQVALVADLPPAVRLHLFSVIAAVAVLPFTALGLALAWPLVALKRSAAAVLGLEAGAES